MLRKTNSVLAAVFLFSRAAAWGPDGHTIVAHIADYYLSSDVKNLLASDLFNVSLNNASDWNDDYDHTPEGKWSSPLHFVNYPGRACKFDWATDCKNDWCNPGAIVNYTKQVFDTSNSKEVRFFALKFVIHMVGDLHQPLHVSSGDDYGGNDIKIPQRDFTKDPAHWDKYNGNLHSCWDGSILVQDIEDIAANHTGLGYKPHYHQWQLLAEKLEKKMDAEWASNKKEWQATVAGVRDEAGFRKGLTTVTEETAERGCKYAYYYKDGTAVKSGDTLPYDYYLAARPIVEEQLAKGGVRLAQILEEALKGSPAPAPSPTPPAPSPTPPAPTPKPPAPPPAPTPKPPAPSPRPPAPSPAAASCKVFGCKERNKANPCQCDDHCYAVHDCCHDYQKVCDNARGELFV